MIVIFLKLPIIALSTLLLSLKPSDCLQPKKYTYKKTQPFLVHPREENV